MKILMERKGKIYNDRTYPVDTEDMAKILKEKGCEEKGSRTLPSGKEVRIFVNNTFKRIFELQTMVFSKAAHLKVIEQVTEFVNSLAKSRTVSPNQIEEDARRFNKIQEQEAPAVPNCEGPSQGK